MKYFSIFLLILSSFISRAQYKINSSIKPQYQQLFQRLPEKIINSPNSKNGLGILTSVKTDTLNKEELINSDSNFYITNNETGEKELLVVRNEDDLITEESPIWIDCNCKFKSDTLDVTATSILFSGFKVTTSIFNKRAFATYYEIAYHLKPFKTKLADDKLEEFTIPATINSLVLDRKPKKGIGEIYGKMNILSNGYYSFLEAAGFKNNYIYKRMNLLFYFRCNPKDEGEELVLD